MQKLLIALLAFAVSSCALLPDEAIDAALFEASSEIFDAYAEIIDDNADVLTTDQAAQLADLRSTTAASLAAANLALDKNDAATFQAEFNAVKTGLAGMREIILDAAIDEIRDG